MDDIHSCGYHCTRPACVLRQRNDLRGKLLAEQLSTEPIATVYRDADRQQIEFHTYVPEGETIRLYATPPQQAEPDAVLAEREACAQILDRNAAVCENNSMVRDVLVGNALAIRARGKG